MVFNDVLESKDYISTEHLCNLKIVLISAFNYAYVNFKNALDFNNPFAIKIVMECYISDMENIYNEYCYLCTLELKQLNISGFESRNKMRKELKFCKSKLEELTND